MERGLYFKMQCDSSGKGGEADNKGAVIGSICTRIPRKRHLHTIRERAHMHDRAIEVRVKGKREHGYCVKS